MREDFSVMLYVTNLDVEAEWWGLIGCVVEELPAGPLRGFSVRMSPESAVSFTLYERAAVAEFSPEVVDNQPSVLFAVDDLEDFHRRVLSAREQLVSQSASSASGASSAGGGEPKGMSMAESMMVTDVAEEPFRNFAFASPSGAFYAVREHQG